MVEDFKTIFNIRTFERLNENAKKDKKKTDKTKMSKTYELEKTIKNLKIGTGALILTGVISYTISSLTFKYGIELRDNRILVELITLVPSYISGMLIAASGLTLFMKDKRKQELEKLKQGNSKNKAKHA